MTAHLPGSAEPWYGPAVPTRETCVLKYVLEARAAQSPDRVYVEFENGTRWTYLDAWRLAQASAGSLSALGLVRGDVLFVWLPNGPEFFRIWLGANVLGVIVAAPNTAYRGGVLRHLYGLADAKMAVVQDRLLEHLQMVDLANTRQIVVVGDFPSVSPLSVDLLRWDQMPSDSLTKEALEHVVEPWDTQFIIFTSGTTGPSKGVLVTYVQMFSTAMAHYDGHLGAEDRYLVNLPLFHISGLLPSYGAMLTGGSIAVVAQFKTDTFWDVVRRHGITGCTLVGAAASFLENQPIRSDDAEHPLRWISMFPLVSDPPVFARRFGVSITTAYGMSELSIPIMSPPNPARPDSCGQLRPGYEARVVDDFDRMVPDGEPGELILRADCPWAITPGYWRDPVATAEAWRNGWFHTGDMFRRNAAGDYFFIDRKKDAIRRRGENISSYEVELEIRAHPDVSEAAVIAVPSPQGEDEVMAVVVRTPGATFSAESLLEFLRPRMARFMLPSHIRFVKELIKTPTFRVQKHILRAEGITADTWSRVSEAGPGAGTKVAQREPRTCGR